MGPEFECGNAGNGTAMRESPQPQPEFTAMALNDPTSPIRPNAIWICRANQNAAHRQKESGGGFYWNPSTSPAILLVRLAVLNYFSPAHTSQVERTGAHSLCA